MVRDSIVEIKLWRKQMRRYVVIAACAAGLFIAAPASALATVSPTTGQPGAPANTCGPDNPVTPGAAANSPGSPFNANGQAGVVYAGNPNTASLAHANSTVAVSQYDSACVHLSN
jgi:hypothetical protein